MHEDMLLWCEQINRCTCEEIFKALATYVTMIGLEWVKCVGSVHTAPKLCAVETVVL